MKNAIEPATVRRPRGRPRTVDAESRRADIIDCAQRTFVELGFAGTTTDIVAARARISKRTLYEQFPSKSELFAAVVSVHRHAMLDLPRPEDEDVPVAEGLERIFRIGIEEEAEQQREALIHLIFRESTQFPELWDLMQIEGVAKSRGELANWLVEQQRRGKLRPDDAMVCARMLMDVVFGAIGPPHRRRHDLQDRALRTRHIQKCFEIFVRGGAPD